MLHTSHEHGSHMFHHCKAVVWSCCPRPNLEHCHGLQRVAKALLEASQGYQLDSIRCEFSTGSARLYLCVPGSAHQPDVGLVAQSLCTAMMIFHHLHPLEIARASLL